MTRSIRCFSRHQHLKLSGFPAGIADVTAGFNRSLIGSSTQSVTVIEGIPSTPTATIVMVGDRCQVVHRRAAASLSDVRGLVQFLKVTRR